MSIIRVTINSPLGHGRELSEVSIDCNCSWRLGSTCDENGRLAASRPSVIAVLFFRWWKYEHEWEFRMRISASTRTRTPNVNRSRLDRQISFFHMNWNIRRRFSDSISVSHRRVFDWNYQFQKHWSDAHNTFVKSRVTKRIILFVLKFHKQWTFAFLTNRK